MSHIHIDISGLSFEYEKGLPVLDNISVSFHEHDSVGIIGANAAGKSTFLKLLVGLEMPPQGSIRIEEIPVEKNTLSKIREKIGYVFQDSDTQLFMTTVQDDVAFAPRNYGLPEDEVARRVARALDLVHIPHLAGKPIYKLSGGEKKLASIATILAMEPDIIIMDEPSIALDPRNRRNLINILNEIKALKIITSHDLDFVMDTCKRTILLDDGRIIADGDTDVILRDKDLLTSHSLELPLSLSRI